MNKLYEKLMSIQVELKAPKTQINSFGKYKYRNCEDIMKAVKPLLLKYKATILLADLITSVDGWTYVTATASFVCIETGEKIHVSASAREPESKKGMDSSQITGAASSYARKYALNGLLLIDDTKDSDNQAEGSGGVKAIFTKDIFLKSKAGIIAMIDKGSNIEQVKTSILKKYASITPETLTLLNKL